MAGLYLLGIGVGILIAFLYKGTLFKGEPVPFVMELPNYHLPGQKCDTASVGKKQKDFPAACIFGYFYCNDRGLVPAEF